MKSISAHFTQENRQANRNIALAAGLPFSFALITSGYFLKRWGYLGDSGRRFVFFVGGTSLYATAAMAAIFNHCEAGRTPLTTLLPPSFEEGSRCRRRNISIAVGLGATYLFGALSCFSPSRLSRAATVVSGGIAALVSAAIHYIETGLALAEDPEEIGAEDLKDLGRALELASFVTRRPDPTGQYTIERLMESGHAIGQDLGPGFEQIPGPVGGALRRLATAMRSTNREQYLPGMVAALRELHAATGLASVEGFIEAFDCEPNELRPGLLVKALGRLQEQCREILLELSDEPVGRSLRELREAGQPHLDLLMQIMDSPTSVSPEGLEGVADLFEALSRVTGRADPTGLCSVENLMAVTPGFSQKLLVPVMLLGGGFAELKSALECQDRDAYLPGVVAALHTLQTDLELGGLRHLIEALDCVPEELRLDVVLRALANILRDHPEIRNLRPNSI